jgi:flagellar hook assembly protein FlgD
VNRENSLRIFIQPKTISDKKVDMNVKIVILDNLGNCVHIDNRKLDSDRKVEISWNGTNRKGRLVGTGTYALYIESMDNVAKTITKEQARKIAVKNIERKK